MDRIVARRAGKRDLNERNQILLRALVRQYIRDGQPVGSKTLARTAGLELSPATIRNIMKDLEAQGLIRSPHTSAGRVPTAQGYRFYVDSLVKVGPLEEQVEPSLRRHLDAAADTQSLLDAASRFLSGVTGMASVVTVPRRDNQSIREIDFMPLSENRVLVIVITNEGEVQNRIIQTHRSFSPDELTGISNWLNAQFAGREIAQIRQGLAGELKADREQMDRLMRSAIDMAEHLFIEESPEQEALVVAGQTNLMEYEELSDIEKLRRLFEAFNRKQEILHVLDQCLTASGVQIFIGEESGYRPLDECSIVSAAYEKEGQVLGVLGVIGPTRMDYSRVISVVDVTARVLGATLKSL